MSGVVIGQCRKKRLFLGRNQPVGQPSLHLSWEDQTLLPGNDVQKAQETRYPELLFNAHLSQHKEVYVVLIKAGPRRNQAGGK